MSVKADTPSGLSAGTNADLGVELDDPGSGQTLLAVSPVPPWPATDGMSLRVSRLLEQLASRWRIVLVCPSGGESAAEHGVRLAAQINFPRSAQWMYLPSQYDVKQVIRAVTESVQAHRPAVALLWSGMEYLREDIPAMPPSVSDRVDCMTLSAWRLLSHARGGMIFRRRLTDFAYVARYEYRMRQASRATVVVGEADASVLRSLFRVQNVHVIPNGVEVSDAVTIARSPRPVVMFTGVMSYQPNIDAVLYFTNSVWPAIHKRIPSAVFQIVGRNPGPDIVALGMRPGIEVHPDVESVQDFLSRAWLAVAPMRTGCGIKNKILEAWSVGTPVVMTRIATNGLAQAPADLLLTAEGEKLAVLAGDLLLDQNRREMLGILARSTAKRTFSWHTHASTLDRLLQSVSR